MALSSNEQKKASSFNTVPETDRSRLIAARRHGQSSDRDKAVRDRGSDLGGMRLQLNVTGSLPGYHLYWANDEDGYVEALLMDGFDFVTQDELYQKEAKVVPDLDITSCISRFVKGTRSDGQALRAYLMKCPDEIWSEREKRRHSEADRRDSEIRRAAQDPNAGAGFYKPTSVNSVVDTSFRKEYLVK